MSEFKTQIDKIFKILIKKNKSLEINVSGLLKELKTTLPDYDLIQRYYELGGRLITVGTDSHSTEYVGKGIETGLNIAKKAGFKQYAIYEKHNPVFIDIP